MFVGMQDYTVRSEYYPREMGESCPPRKQPKSGPYNEYRPREMGEKPWEVPSREQQQANYDRTRDSYKTPPTRSTYESRPREMGETPEDVARAEAKKPKTWDEMTEQERVLDMYA